MKVIFARNAHQALSAGLYHLDSVGVTRESRNGGVIVAPHPVTTVYGNSLERVVFWPERDANPFFHVYESLWMLAGRKDVNSVARYAKRMKTFSDDGESLNAAYGYRWRYHFGDKWKSPHYDQLRVIAERLKKDPNDRRSVLAMWDAHEDLGNSSKDVPCNLVVTFQIGQYGQLDMTVFCRSNDILWGAYGANVVHFSVLHEYMANWIGVGIGTFTQISVNWHAYTEVLDQVKNLPRSAFHEYDPYSRGEVRPTPMTGNHEYIDAIINDLLTCADRGQFRPGHYDNEWADVMNVMLHAHHVYKNNIGQNRYSIPMNMLAPFVHQKSDWARAGYEWIERRFKKWDNDQSSQAWRGVVTRGISPLVVAQQKVIEEQAATMTPEKAQDVLRSYHSHPIGSDKCTPSCHSSLDPRDVMKREKK